MRTRAIGRRTRTLRLEILMRRAFTLVELLVVLAIIVVLLGLLLPGLRAARMQALSTQDMALQRSLMQAHVAYMNVHGERFVDVGLPHGTPADPSLSFVNRLRPYFGGSSAAFKSPLDYSPHWSAEDGGDGVPVVAGDQPIWRHTSYGMNNYLSRTFSPAVALDGPEAAVDRLNVVRDPSQVVCFLLMTEVGTYASADHPHVEEWGSAPDPARQAATQCLIDAIGRSRPGSDSRSNYAFLDCRVESRQFGDVFRSAASNKFDPELQRQQPAP